MATAKQKQAVNLYYLGGLTEEGVQGVINSGGRAYPLPERGRFMRVFRYVAEDIMSKHNITSVLFTLDARLAEDVRTGRVNSVAMPKMPHEYTEAELLTMLAALSTGEKIKAPHVAPVVDGNDELDFGDYELPEKPLSGDFDFIGEPTAVVEEEVDVVFDEDGSLADDNEDVKPIPPVISDGVADAIVPTTPIVKPTKHKRQPTEKA